MHGFIHQHCEIRPYHLVTIGFRRLVIAGSLGILTNLAEDPRIRGSGTADQHSIAARRGHPCDTGFRGANIAVAAHATLDGILHPGTPLPACIAVGSLPASTTR